MEEMARYTASQVTRFSTLPRQVSPAKAALTDGALAEIAPDRGTF